MDNKMAGIAIGSDRRGFEYKCEIQKHLRTKGYTVIDVGPYNDSLPVDYPLYGERVGQEVTSGRCQFGVVICATGIGIMIAANKVKGIRCGIAYSDEVAQKMREHNDANVIAFGQSQMALDDVIRRLNIFLTTDFLGGYHQSRIQQIHDIENGIAISQSPIKHTFGR